MGFPRFADFIFVLSDKTECGARLPRVQSKTLGQFDLRLQPILVFPGSTLHAHVNSSFFAREEIESERAMPENRGAHPRIVTENSNGSNCTGPETA